MGHDVVIGEREWWGRKVPLVLSHADRRQHLLVIGKSGVGKSTFLRNMILQDIEAGRGVAFLDPHGDDARSLLDQIPGHRIDDVVYFDPADAEFPIGFNPLAAKYDRHLAASGIVGAFKGIWGEFFGPRMEYILYAAVAALLECEGVTLLGLQRMLVDRRYRSWVVRQVKDPVVRSFWVTEFEGYSDKFMQEAIAPIQNKVGQLLMSPLLRNVLGQVKGRFDARYLMDNRRIFIANLSKGRLGEDKSNLIGSLLVTEFQLAAMSRSKVREHERQDFALVADEFHSYATDSFVSILSEARKYRLCLTLAQQYITQAKPEIRDAVFGNVGSIVSFRVGQSDAEILEREFGHAYARSQFVHLDNYEVCAKILANGREVEPCLARTLPPQAKRYGKGETIIDQSRKRYSMPRAVAEDKIRRWLR